MTVCERLLDWVVGRHRFVLRIFLFMVIWSFGGCLEAFTQATNQPPRPQYEAQEEPLSNELPTPQLLDIRLNISDD